MFKLQIEVTSIEDAERILACLKHSADPAAVRQVGEQLTGFGAGDMTEAAAQGFRDGVKSGTPPVDEKPKNPRGRPRRQVAPPVDNAHVADGCEKFEESAAPEQASTASSVPSGESSPAQQTLTLADIRTALQAVQAKNPSDMQPVIAMLEKFGAARVSDVKVEDYPAFIEACKKAS